MSDVRALIEEARQHSALPVTDWLLLPSLVGRLADSLEVEASARRELVDKIEALTVLVGKALGTYDVMKTSATGLTPFDWGHVISDLREMQRLLGLVSGDNNAGESSNG